jgi:acyl-coenzyme A synthetase/AMP-(fatty) acid ligase
MIKTFTNKIYNFCGTSETFLNEMLTPFDLPEKAGKTGRPPNDDDVRVVKVYMDKLAEPEDMVRMDDVEVGEIAVKTLKGTIDYINNEKEFVKRIKGDWFYPGDLATWDAEQFITIKSRKDDMIIVGGNNVYPIQIEEIIKKHSKVYECAVVGAPDRKRGSIVVAYIVKKDDSLTDKELREFVNKSQMLSHLEKPRHYIFVKEIPTTATGKKQHYILRQNVLNDIKNGLLN